MTYAPINIPVYVASYSGAIAGMGVSGWIVDPAQAHYDAITKIAGAFAQAFDIAWNDATDLNNLESAAITSIVSTEFSERGPGPLENPRFQTVANWDIGARACIALVLESDAYFAGQGIDPGTGGGGGSSDHKVKVTSADTTAAFLQSKLVAGSGVTLTLVNPGANETLSIAASGGGGGILSLSNVVFVDKNGTGAAPDGSIANPFTTVTAAVAAVEGFGNGANYTIYCTPYDYTNEGLLTLPLDLSLTFIGLTTGLLTQLPNMAVLGSSVAFENCTIGHFTGDETDGVADINGGCTLTFKNANCYKVQGNTSYLLCFGQNSRNQQNNISDLGGTFANINFSGYSFSSSGTSVDCTSLDMAANSSFNCQDWTGTQFHIRDSSFGGNVTCNGNGDGSADNCDIGSGTWAGWTVVSGPPSFQFRNCTMSSWVSTCDADAIAMDSNTMTSFGRKAQFATSSSSVNRIASNDVSAPGFNTFADADITYTMSYPNHVIIPQESVTAPRLITLDTTNGSNKQVFTIDNYGQGNNVVVQQVSLAALYTFNNAAGTTVRATFRVLSQVGNTFELQSIEKIGNN